MVAPDPTCCLEPEYKLDDQEISDSDLERLYLTTRVCGVLYHRDDDGKAAATVLLEVRFFLPRGVEMGEFCTHANLPIRSKTLSL
jgi:hypothetical protein